MTRHHATVNGNVAFTAEEEAARDAEEASFLVEQAAEKVASIRAERNRLLTETDFYALSDVTMTSNMTTYRQALRDITSHSNWPNLESDDWPTKP